MTENTDSSLTLRMTKQKIASLALAMTSIKDFNNAQ